MFENGCDYFFRNFILNPASPINPNLKDAAVVDLYWFMALTMTEYRAEGHQAGVTVGNRSYRESSDRSCERQDLAFARKALGSMRTEIRMPTAATESTTNSLLKPQPA